MSIFHWLRGSDREPELSPELRRRLDELDEKNRKTQKALSDLELDWSEWFNKFRLLYARLTKRINDEEKKSIDDRAGDGNGTRAISYDRPAPLQPNRQRKNY